MMNTQESILKTIEDKREQYIHAALDIWVMRNQFLKNINLLPAFQHFLNRKAFP